MTRARFPLRLWIPGVLLAAGLVMQLVLLQVESSRGERRAERAVTEQAVLIDTMISARLEAALRSAHPSDAAGLMGLLAAERRVRHAALAEPDGTILFATEILREGRSLRAAGYERALGVFERARATDRIQVEVIREPPLVVAAAPVKLPTTLGVVPRLGALVALHELAQPLAEARVVAVRRALVQGASFLGASLLLYLLLHLAVLRRLRRLEGASDRLARGDYGARADLRGHDELAVLGRSFDQMAADIGARDQALRDEAARTESLLQNLNDAILVVDADDEIRQATGGALRTLGVEAIALEGRALAALLDPGERDQLTAALDRARGLQSGSIDLELRAAPDAAGAAARFLELRIAAPPGAEERLGGGLVVTVRDVTERRRLHGEVQLRQKMELVAQMAGGVAHDFNNLLSAIMLSAEAAIAAAPTDGPQRALLVELYETAIRGGALTRQLLSLGRRDLVKTAPTDVNAVIGELESLVRRIVPSNVELHIELATDACWIRANEGMLEQILINLLVNARDAMPEGGALWVRTRTQREPRGPIVIEVEDTGTGIDPAIRPRIFEPLVTTKAIGKGTGLGLATVHSIVQELDGEIAVNSRIGEGTRFTLSFPAETAPAAGREDRPALEPGAGAETVLVVEDDAALRAGVARALRAHGYRVVACGSAESALQQLPALAQDAPALLTDLMLPGLDGLALWRRSCEIVPELPVVFMSGYAELSMRSEIERSEVEVLQKPVDGRVIARALRAAIDRKRGRKRERGHEHEREREREHEHEHGRKREREHEREPRTIAADDGSPTVLVADDETAVRRVLQAILEDAGYRIVTAGDGVEAVEQFRRHRGTLSAVILDMAMPRMRGIEVLEAISSIDPRVPVLASSGAGSAEIDLELRSGRLVGFVPKPFTRGDIIGALKAAMGRAPSRAADSG